MNDREGAASAWQTALAGLDQADDQALAEQNRQLIRASFLELHPKWWS